MKTIFNMYEEKVFSVPKALMFGQYKALSFEAKMMYVLYQEISCYDNEGTLYLEIEKNKMVLKDEIVNELVQFQLIYIKGDCIYFNTIEIDNTIINAIDKLENRKAISHVPIAVNNVNQNQRDELMNKAYFASEEVPQQLAHTLKTFSRNIDEADEYYAIIMKAKKKVEAEVDMVLWIEHDDELNEAINNSFVRSVRKINQSNITNRNGYMYKAIYKSISDLIASRQHTTNPMPIYNWLEE